MQPALLDGIEIRQDANAPLWEKAVLLDVTVSIPGNTRKVSTGNIDVDADKEMLNVNKKLLDSKEYEAVQSVASELRTYVYSRSLPGPFKSGIYLLPIDLLPEVDAKLRMLRDKLSVTADAFMLSYSRARSEAEGRLRSLYNAADYMEPADLRAKFGVTWRYLQLGTPGALKTISESLWKEEQAKMEAAWQDAGTEITKALRVGFAELVDRMAERLTPGPDGKAKTFRDTLVTNLTEFMQTFDARNITNDAELNAVVCQVRELINGVSPETLRKSDGVRSQVAEGIQAIASQLDQFVTDRPSRKIK